METPTHACQGGLTNQASRIQRGISTYPGAGFLHLITFRVQFCLINAVGVHTELGFSWLGPSNNRSNHLKSPATGAGFRTAAAKLIPFVGLLPGEGDAVGWSRSSSGCEQNGEPGAECLLETGDFWARASFELSWYIQRCHRNPVGMP